MTESQYEAIEQQERIMRSTLSLIAHSDCEYIDFREDESTPCTCNPCKAKSALIHSRDWRYEGAVSYRVHNGHNPRETRMVMSLKNKVDDQLLARILDHNRENDKYDYLPPPSARDWYVATSVIQWLATNCGMAVLEDAGFKYSKWDEDKEQRDSK